MPPIRAGLKKLRVDQVTRRTAGRPRSDGSVGGEASAIGGEETKRCERPGQQVVVCSDGGGGVLEGCRVMIAGGKSLTALQPLGDMPADQTFGAEQVVRSMSTRPRARAGPDAVRHGPLVERPRDAGVMAYTRSSISK